MRTDIFREFSTHESDLPFAATFNEEIECDRSLVRRQKKFDGLCLVERNGLKLQMIREAFDDMGALPIHWNVKRKGFFPYHVQLLRPSIPSNRIALKTTASDTPMSAAMAVQRLAWPRMVSTTNAALMPSEAVMFWRMIRMVRCE